MTPKQINEMQAGREMDALVGTLVFGLPNIQLKDAQCPYCGSKMRWCGTRANCPEHSWIYSPYKEYSTSIEHAWAVVEKMQKELMWSFSITGVMPLSSVMCGVHVAFVKCVYPPNDRNLEDTFCARGENAPLAICRASLLAICSVKNPANNV